MKENKLLLISILERQYNNLGISQLAGYLRSQGKKVDLLFFHKNEDDDFILNQTIGEHTHFAFSVFQSNIVQIKRISQKIKERNEKVRIIFGGPFATIYYREIARDIACVDYIVLGDGEIPMMRLLSGRTDYPYIYVRENESDSYLAYRNSAIANWAPAEDYFHINRGSGHVHCILTKNNVCTGACTFCCTKKSGYIEYRSNESIISEITRLNDLYSISYFYFVDDDLFDPNNHIAKKRIYDLCKALIELNKNLHFYCYAKATTFSDSEYDSALLDVMHMAGFDTVFIGVESANEQDLILYNKKNRIDDNYRSIRLLKEHFIYPMIGFICFNPYSTLNTIKENFLFLINTKVHEFVNYVKSFLEIYKGSPMFKLAEKENLFGDNYNYMNLDDFRFVSDDREVLVKIVTLLRNKFSDDEFIIAGGWSRFSIYYYGLLRDNKSLMMFMDEYSVLEQKYFDIMYSYFSKLYVENDFKYCEENYSLFVDQYRSNIREMEKLKARIIRKNMKGSWEKRND